MSEKIFLDNHGIINWIPENSSGDLVGTKLSVDVMASLVEEKSPAVLLVDLSKAKRPTREQRDIIINGLQVNAHHIKKIALFGQTPLMKVISYYIIHATNFDTMRFFDSRTEAIAWLRD